MPISGPLLFLVSFVYFVCIIGVIIYVLVLLVALFRTQERMAGALEIIARKLQGDNKP